MTVDPVFATGLLNGRRDHHITDKGVSGFIFVSPLSSFLDVTDVLICDSLIRRDPR